MRKSSKDIKRAAVEKELQTRVKRLSRETRYLERHAPQIAIVAVDVIPNQMIFAGDIPQQPNTDNRQACALRFQYKLNLIDVYGNSPTLDIECIQPSWKNLYIPNAMDGFSRKNLSRMLWGVGFSEDMQLQFKTSRRDMSYARLAHIGFTPIPEKTCIVLDETPFDEEEACPVPVHEKTIGEQRVIPCDMDVLKEYITGHIVNFMSATPHMLRSTYGIYLTYDKESPESIAYMKHIEARYDKEYSEIEKEYSKILAAIDKE